MSLNSLSNEPYQDKEIKSSPLVKLVCLRISKVMMRASLSVTVDRVMALQQRAHYRVYYFYNRFMGVENIHSYSKTMKILLKFNSTKPV